MSSDNKMLSGSFEDQLREYKTTLAKRAVHECNGNKKTLAAQNLSISRAYLHRLIRISEEDISTGDINAP
jgi:DNA-binding NtrC family response regulator